MTSTTTNVASIEEIVKYQQELLNHQRNQKLIQKETIKLLNALNKSLSLMSDRLDEFANKTNIKLDDGTQNNAQTILTNNPQSITLALPATSTNLSNDVIFLTAEHLNNSINSICNTVNTTLTTLNTKNTFTNNTNSSNTFTPAGLATNHTNQSTNDIKELFILNDFSTSLLDTSTNSSVSAGLATTPSSSVNSTPIQPTILLNGAKLNTIKIQPHTVNPSANFIALAPTLNSLNVNNGKTCKFLDVSFKIK